MKKYVVLIFLFSIFIFPFMVSADDTYINNNNVHIPVSVYNDLKKMFTEAYISVLTQDEYDEIINAHIDYDSLEIDNKYYRTEYNPFTGESIDIEISKEEYDNATPSEIAIASSVETAYKRFSLVNSDTGSTNTFMAILLWKIPPSVRSYDIIGVRLGNGSLVGASQSGKQIYTVNGNTHSISYSYNGTNIKNFSNGFGISMNLVNDNVTYLECSIYGMASNVSGLNTVFASYQHATTNISLATSKSYSLGSGGLGNVFVFSNTNYYSYFDNMSGLYYSYYA